MKNTTITCDICKRDLKTTTNSVDYRIAVINERIPIGSDTVTDMMIHPALERDFHFCGLRCLREWAKTV